jgi:8-oxo-dGTP diphosphatase
LSESNIQPGRPAREGSLVPAGGTIRREESAVEAAKRELVEETTLVVADIHFQFQFGGLNKRHQVFFTELLADARPEPGNEILRCRWFRPRKVATLATSVPTREIVKLVFGDNLLSPQL